MSPTDNPPTARSMLPQRYLCLWVSCRGGCLRGAAADLQAIIDAGQGDKPIKDLKFRCTKCGSRRTDSVVMSLDVPPSIGPVVFGTLGVGWVMVRCPQQYDELMRRAGGVWEPGARQWLVERRRIGPVIRELERTVDPLFRRVGIHLDG